MLCDRSDGRFVITHSFNHGYFIDMIHRVSKYAIHHQLEIFHSMKIGVDSRGDSLWDIVSTIISNKFFPYTKTTRSIEIARQNMRRERIQNFFQMFKIRFLFLSSSTIF